MILKSKPYKFFLPQLALVMAFHWSNGNSNLDRWHHTPTMKYKCKYNNNNNTAEAGKKNVKVSETRGQLKMESHQHSNIRRDRKMIRCILEIWMTMETWMEK